MAGKVKLKVVPSMFSDFIEKLNTVASIDDTVKLKIDNENILMYAMLGGGNVILAFKNFLLPTKEYFDNDMEDFSLDIIIPSAKRFVKYLAFIKDMDKIGFDVSYKESPDDAAGLYVISVAAELSGLHPQTLRQYDRLGLVSPNRTIGRNRRYSLRDIASLRMVGRLVGEGINHAGIKRIIELESAMANMAIEVAQLRIEVDALIKDNPPKSLVRRKKNDVILYKED